MRAAVKKSRPQPPNVKGGKGSSSSSNKRNIETAAFEIAKGERGSLAKELLLGCEMQLGEAEGLEGR